MAYGGGTSPAGGRGVGAWEEAQGARPVCGGSTGRQERSVVLVGLPPDISQSFNDRTTQRGGAFRRLLSTCHPRPPRDSPWALLRGAID